MPKNKGKGGKKFRRGKHTNETDRTLLLCDKEENQCYGLVTKTLGSGRFEVNCYEQDANNNFIMNTRQCLVRGNMRKKVWVNVNDLVLISLRTFQNDKADIMYKYKDYEIVKLKKINEIPDISDIGGNDEFSFGNDDDADIDNIRNNKSYADIYDISEDEEEEEESN